MAPQHFSHFATNRSLLARDYWRAGPKQNRHLALDLCKEVLWRDLKIPMACALTIIGGAWSFVLGAVAGMLELRGPQDVSLAELQKMIALMQARGDHSTAERLRALAAEA
jgi:hypothetical protein